MLFAVPLKLNVGPTKVQTGNQGYSGHRRQFQVNMKAQAVKQKGLGRQSVFRHPNVQHKKIFQKDGNGGFNPQDKYYHMRKNNQNQYDSFYYTRPAPNVN